MNRASDSDLVGMECCGCKLSPCRVDPDGFINSWQLVLQLKELGQLGGCVIPVAVRHEGIALAENPGARLV